MLPNHFDVIVVGAGPGGSTLATLLVKQGLKVALVERDKFPRFKIGESLLPHSMDILKLSGVFDKIDSGKYIRKHGATFVDYQEDEPIYFEFAHALDSDHPFAFEVPRDEFDRDLLDHAKSCGVEVLQPVLVKKIDHCQSLVKVETSAGSLTCDYIADASGRQALLGTQLSSRKKNHNFINNIAIFNHYRNVKRTIQKKEGDIIIGVLPGSSWSWHIPFLGATTSVGVVCAPETFQEYKDSDDIVRAITSRQPHLAQIMAEAIPLREQQIVANYSYSSTEKIGGRWLMIGDAATFLDPVFSSGVHISLTSACLAAEVLLEAHTSGKQNLNHSLKGQSYQADLQLGVDRFQSLLLLFYKTAFIKNMKKIIRTDNLYRSFTSAFSGDMWNEDNCLFRLGVLKDGELHEENYLI